MSTTVDYFFSMVSPWVYIGHDAFHEMVARRDVTVNYKPMALLEVFERTDTPTLPKRHQTRRDYRMLELQRWRARRGLDFKLQPAHWPFPAAPADRMVIAIVQGGASPAAFMRAVFGAVWEQNRDLSRPDALANVAAAVGLDGSALVRAADTDATGAAYRANTEEFVALGGFGAPVYALNGEIFWGQDRIELLEDAIVSGRAPFKAAG
jgi:2-hydroxychromene-2-carboxylate isomerase